MKQYRQSSEQSAQRSGGFGIRRLVTSVMSGGRLRRSPWLVVPIGFFTACGPVGNDGFGNADGAGAWPGTGGIVPAAGGLLSSGGAPSTGGGSSCDAPAPQRTYVCAGYAYEGEAQSAAFLSLTTEYCSTEYPGTGGWISVGGGPSGGFGAQSAGGGHWDEAPIDSGGSYGGYAGEPTGIGGYYYPGGGTSVGGSLPATGGRSNEGGGSLVDRWCESDPEGTIIGGLSFAVGSCQDVDVALPLLFQEPYYGEYEVVIYGSYSPCDRAYPITTAAGIGAGQVLEIPFSTQGYSFISVEVRSEELYLDFGVRLRDRPHVVPSPGE